MKKYIVIGNPIEHSLSPKLHNHWIKKNKINAVYDKKLVNENDIIESINIKRLNGCGLDTLKGEYHSNFRSNPHSNKLLRLAKNKNHNVVITPKIGGAVIEAWIKTEQYLIKQIIKEVQ